MRASVCLTICSFVVVCAAFSVNGYIFMCPRSLKIGSPNELQLLSFSDHNSKGFFKVSLYSIDTSYNKEKLLLEKEFTIETGKMNYSYQLQVDALAVNNAYIGRLMINGTIGNKTFGGSDLIFFSTPKNKLILIQTDKPLYNPGQKVQLRVLKLDKALKPSGSKNDVGNVYVEDAKGTRLVQFKNVSLGSGLAQMHLPLSHEPVLGTWTITVKSENDTETTTFDVKRYVPPKFGVKINFPPYVLSTAESIPVQICAKYTYGKNVVGELHINTSLEFSSGKDPVLHATTQIDGCHNYTLNVSLIEPSIYTSNRIAFVAKVIEKQTGEEMNTTEFLKRAQWPLNVNFKNDENERQYFKPGLPYNGKIQVTNPDDTPAPQEPIEICATISRERMISNWFATRKIKICKTYNSNNDGNIRYAIPPQNTDSTQLVLEATSINYKKEQDFTGVREKSLSTPTTIKYLRPYYSPSGSFIQLAAVGHVLPCGKEKSLRLLFTSKVDADYEFNYQIISKGEVVQRGISKVSFKVKDDLSSQFTNNSAFINGSEIQIVPSPNMPNASKNSSEEHPAIKESRYVAPIGEATIKINVGVDLSPSFTLLVFYVRDDQETVADSHKFEVEKCFKNKVNFAFEDKVKQPATKTSLKVHASPNSLCGIRVIDKSIALLDSREQLTAPKVFQLLENMNSYSYHDPSYSYCSEHGQPGLPDSKPAGGRKSSDYKDSFTAFQDSGYLVISNLKIFTRPCNKEGGNGEGAAASASGTVTETSSTKSAVNVRDYFPETWLFNLHRTGPDGVFLTKEKLPHTITEWIGTAACVNPTDGLGISNSTSIKGFQAFFIDYTLPVSVVRGEEVGIGVSISSYADAALPIKVSLDNPKGFQVTNGSIDGELCIQPGTHSNLRINLKATAMGKVNITVQAETASSSSVCGKTPVSKAVAKDAITKALTVDAEGYPQEESRNVLFCPANNPNRKYSEPFKVYPPEDVVNDTFRAYVDVTGNLIGQAIQNLNELVALPTGCGEQNMVNFNPNYLVLDYLKEFGNISETMKATAIQNLNVGYQTELNYQRPDGSFSAFGEVDEEGSMFLTAFVLRSFHEAKRYISIEDSVIIQMQNWIASKQAVDGHFPNIGRIINYNYDLEGGLEKKNSGAITAYVLASLLISGYKNKTVLDSAKSYLKTTNSPHLTAYETFLFAYAEALAGDNETAKNRISKIKPQANITDGEEYYNNPNATNALYLETAAYAVLANLEVGNGAPSVLSLVRYMIKNLSPRGGFYSTQDTCVGLEALSKFAKLVLKDPVDILVSVSGDMKESYNVSESNKLVVQRKMIPKFPCEFLIEATGSGCGVVQVTLRYNTKHPRVKKIFKLGVNTECLNKKCTRLGIKVSVSYIPKGKGASMSIVEVKMLSGFVADKAVLEALVKDKNSTILRSDVENNKVIFYLSGITNEGTQFSFQANQAVEVSERSPAFAYVYDYYAPEHVESTSYKHVIGIDDKVKQNKS